MTARAALVARRGPGTVSSRGLVEQVEGYVIFTLLVLTVFPSTLESPE